MGELSINNQFYLNDLQRNSWEKEIVILKQQLKGLNGRILLEYSVPRLGKRIDCIILIDGLVFLLEFKIGDKEYRKSTYDQAYDYALDLKYFHKESHDKLLVPIAVATEAVGCRNSYTVDDDLVMQPLWANKHNVGEVIREVTSRYASQVFDGNGWEFSVYLPTPSIIEAAQALYMNHNVDEISRSDAEAKNLTITTGVIEKIIEHSKTNRRKSIIFVTGVPGAGKTLVGLNLASKRHDSTEGEHAVFLSGNQPLVSVLQEALVRDKVVRDRDAGKKTNKKSASRQVKPFIQIIHRYRDDYVGNSVKPTERIAIFDEAQRAWTKEAITAFMNRKKGIADFEYSEPEFLIGTMDRLEDWAVIVCLVGGGQEINSGEAGMPEWLESLRRRYTHWDIYTSSRLNDKEYTKGCDWNELIDGFNVSIREELHLATSMRSFRSEHVADFVRALLELDFETAREQYLAIKNKNLKYPIMLTRSINKAKEWVKQKARGSERYGILASSNAARLKPYGIYYAKDRNSISPENWFLNNKDDIRSSYYLEVVASEFETQGLELDYAIVAWDADLRYENGAWGYYSMSNRMSPPNWSRMRSHNNISYLINSYRVLLTRARQGLIIFLPRGSNEDFTRLPEYYDGLYDFLRKIGIDEVE